MNMDQLKNTKDYLLKNIKEKYEAVDHRRKSISAKEYKSITDDEKQYMVKSGDFLLQLRLAIKSIEGVKL